MTGKGLRWAGLAVVAATVVLAVVLAGRFGSDPGLVDSPLLGQPAPDFDLSTLDGSGTAALSDLRGQIVVLNFFASWCLECREEHEDLVAASNSFADDGVQFVQIAYQEATEESLTYLDEAGTSPATLYLADPGSRTAIAGAALTTRNAAVMVAAMARSAWKARTQSRPNWRNTPATMPMTMGIGSAAMARRTSPSAPSAIIRMPVAM